MEIVSYQDFGTAFVDETVTPARIEQAVGQVAGDRVEVGPLAVGPGDAASVLAKGTIGAPKARPLEPDDDGTRRFIVTLPVELHLSVKVAGTLHRFESSVQVHLGLAVRTAARPVSLIIDIPTPTADDLDVDVRASGMVGRVLGRLGNVEAKIRKEVVAFISERLDAPDALAARTIDIGTVAEAMWKS